MQLLTALASPNLLETSVKAGDWATLHRVITALGNTLVSGEKGSVNEEVVNFAASLGLKQMMGGVQIPGSETLAKEVQTAVMSLL